MRAPKFAVGDRVSFSDEMPKAQLDSCGYRRDDVLTVLEAREYRLDDGAVAYNYVISGARWFYEHSLKPVTPSTITVKATLVFDKADLVERIGDLP